MAGEEKPQILDLRRSKMLAAMGIQVWHLRPAAGEAPVSAPESPLKTPLPVSVKPAPAPVSAPVKATVEAPTISATEPPPVPLEFVWVKGTASMLVFSSAASAAIIAHAKDVLRYADWRTQHSAPSSLKTGEFKWPQLLDTTTGTPARALGVFIEKHFPDECPWFLVADDLADDLLPWLRECLPGEAEKKALVLPGWNESVADAALKKQIWKTLQQIC